MMRYRELIEQQLALRQVQLELDLHKANQQAAFIRQVERVLSGLAWGCCMTMDRRLNITFVVPTGKVALEHQTAAVEQALAARFDVWRKPDGVWGVEARQMPDGMCWVRLEAV